ncbi:MAG: pseudouridine synthase [Thiohalomonadaceae bacterium]
MSGRLQKVLARAGLGSRRELEQRIIDGRVSINGKPVKLGDQVSPGDVVRLDGRIIAQDSLQGPERRVLVYHKQAGEVCTRSDPEKRPTIFDRLPVLRHGRWVAVGRLDINTTGIILLTTDGDLANRLMHPSSQVEREYAVRVFGEVRPEIIQNLLAGVMLDDGEAGFDSIVAAGGEGANHWYHVTLREGRNREVRRLWESQGVTVSRLIRVRYGPIHLGRQLRLGRYEDLTGEPLQALLQIVGLVSAEQKTAGKKPASKKPVAPTRVHKSVERKSGRRKGSIDDWSSSPIPSAGADKSRKSGTKELVTRSSTRTAKPTRTSADTARPAKSTLNKKTANMVKRRKQA